RPSTVTFSNSAAAATSSQQLADLVRSGQLPLTMGDLINLILQNNLDVGVNRLSPLSSQYLINTFYLPFEPTLHLQATVGRTTTAGTSSLAGARHPPPFFGAAPWWVFLVLFPGKKKMRWSKIKQATHKTNTTQQNIDSCFGLL